MKERKFKVMNFILLIGGACCLGSFFLLGCNSKTDTRTPLEKSKVSETFKEMQSSQLDVNPILKMTGWKKESVNAFNSSLPDHRIFTALTIADDGQFVVTVPKQDGKPYEILLFNPLTNHIETIAQLKGVDAQCAFADIDNEWIVWSEVLDQQLTDWNVHLYDRKKHIDRIVFSSPKDANGHAYPGPLLSPHLYENQFVFSPTVGPTTDSGPGFVMEKYNIINNELTTIAETGYNPVLSKDFTMWIGYDKNEKDGELFWNQGNKVTQITKGIFPKYFTVQGNDFAWSNNLNNKWTVGLSENGKQTTVAESDEADALQFLTISPRILAWTSYEKTQVYDRKLRKIITLSKKAAPLVTTKGHYLFWAIPFGTPEQQQTIAKETGIVPSRLYLVDLNKI